MQPENIIGTSKLSATKLIVPALIFFAGALIGFAFTSSEPAVNVARNQTASIMIDTGADSIRVYANLTPLAGETLFELTRRVAQENNIPFAYKDYAGLGSLITQIGPVPDTTSGAYWQYWVNNVYAQVGADVYVVRPGDVITWKFTSSKP